MLGRLVPVVAVALLLAAGCGGDRAPTPPAADPATPPTISTTSEPVAPASTSPAATTATTESSARVVAVLRPGGLGPVGFGAPADQALAELTEVLGAPDRVASIEPLADGCVEGAGWLECLQDLRVVDSGQLAVWDGAGLEVAMVDTRRDVWPKEPTALQFGDWHATVAPGDARLVTQEGLSAGMTVGELRATVPWVEFTYNEGLLDSFYVTLGASGGYWGRLDWNPSTDDIEHSDISAIQAALNEHGADLVVDGEWGPRSEAAWLEFLTDHGFEPFTLQPWLMPEIGEALGLPPDDITVATLEPRPATETATSALPILRTDGLSHFDFGEPANGLVSELEAILGPAADDTSYTPDGAGPFSILPMGYWAAHELRIVVWERPDLYLVLSDVPWLGDDFGETTPGALSLVSWETSSPRFTDGNDLAVGSSLADLRFHHPNVVLGTFDVCETEYNPAAFVTMPYDGDTPPLWRGLRGTTDWDWVSDLQIALNDRGASLAIDGEYGPRTSAAVAALEQEIGVYHVDGQIDPEVVAALGLQEPSDATITSLEAGYPGSC